MADRHNREVYRYRDCGDQPLVFRQEFLVAGTKLES
jgi:hypothetical protein